MNSIKMNRLELLEIVRKNKTTHEEQFEESKKDYAVAMEKIAAENIKIAKLNAKAVSKGTAYTELAKSKSWLTLPVSYNTEYNRAIRMLELSVEDTIDVEEDVFNQLVLDEWGWKQQFISSGSLYKTMSQ